MALSANGRNAAVDGLATAAKFVSLHTANPGETGDSEATGGSPAYARKSATWGAAVSGVRSLSSAVTFDVPAGSSIAYFGIWSAISGGTFYGAETLRDTDNQPVVETFGGQGTYTLTVASLAINNAAAS
ncbi:MAG: hypothetical protein ABWY93_18870 [Mycobacterium sp.]